MPTVPIDSYRPVRVTLQTWQPVSAEQAQSLLQAENRVGGIITIPDAGSSQAALLSTLGIVTPKVTGGQSYRTFDVDVEEHFISFKVSTGAGIVAWQGELTLFDSSVDGLGLASILGSFTVDTLIHIQFNVDDHSFSSAPIFQGRVIKARYNISPQGVYIALDMTGDQYLTASLTQYPTLPSFGEGKFRTTSPLKAFTDIAIAAGWASPLNSEFQARALVRRDEARNTVIGEGNSTFVVEGSYFCTPLPNKRPNHLPTIINPDDLQDPYKYAEALAQKCITDKGEPYMFYTKLNSSNGFEYHFHGPSFTTDRPNTKAEKVVPTFNYGDANSGILDVVLNQDSTHAALVGGLNSVMYFVDLDRGANPAELARTVAIKVTNGAPDELPAVKTAGQGSGVPAATPPLLKAKGITAKTAEEAMAKLVQWTADLRRQWLPISLRRLGSHDLDVFDLFEFNYQPRGVKTFICGAYRVLHLEHTVTRDGWTTQYSAYRDNFSIDTPAVIASDETALQTITRERVEDENAFKAFTAANPNAAPAQFIPKSTDPNAPFLLR